MAAFDWTTFASHLNTNLAFDEILNEWDRLAANTPPLRCELASH
jgi:hypothetical protein